MDTRRLNADRNKNELNLQCLARVNMIEVLGSEQYGFHQSVNSFRECEALTCRGWQRAQFEEEERHSSNTSVEAWWHFLSNITLTGMVIMNVKMWNGDKKTGAEYDRV